MLFVRSPDQTPQSAVCHAECANHQLLRPEHRHIPDCPLQPRPAIMPLQLGLNPNHHPFIMGEDPFVLPRPPSLPQGPTDIVGSHNAALLMGNPITFL